MKEEKEGPAISQHEVDESEGRDEERHIVEPKIRVAVLVGDPWL
jgi:hypothetical protein